VKSELLVENVGGLSGRTKFVLESGKLNVIESPNAAGKSTLIKSITAVLSFPSSWEADLPLLVAQRLGLKSKSEGPEPLVNVNANQAVINLSVNGDLRQCRIIKGGGFYNKPPGNEMFLLGSLLTRESEISRKLVEGDSYFEWIVKQMSKAKLYEKVRTSIEKSLNINSVKLEQIAIKIQETAKLSEETEQLRRAIDKVKEERRQVEQKLASLPATDPKVEKAYKDMLEKMNMIEGRRQGLKEELQSIGNEFNMLTRELRILEREIEKRQKIVARLQEDLSAVADAQRIKNWQKQITKIDTETIPSLNSKRERLIGVKDLYDIALRAAGARPEIRCPLCETGTIKIGGLTIQIRKLANEISKIEDENAYCVRQKNELRARIQERESEKKRLNDEIREVQVSLRALKAKYEEEKSIVEAAQTKLELREKEFKLADGEHAELEKRLDVIEKQFKDIGKEEKEFAEHLGKVREKLQSLTEEFDTKNTDLTEKSIEMVDEQAIPLSIAEKLYQTWSKTLESVKNYIDGRIDEQKRGAARTFNMKVKELMKRLEFTEFQEIWLEEGTYNLRVIKKGGKSLPVVSLSASEKYAIATLLQIAVKEAYMPEIPFFIVDEVVLDFDQARKEGFLDYLRETAKERDWFVVVARVADTPTLTVKQI